MIGKISRNSAILTKNEDVLLEIYNKINEIVDAVNELQNRIDPPSVYQVMKDKDAIIGKHIGKKQRLQDELERTRKALDVAVDALNKINMRCQNTVRNHLERATIRGELCDISFYARKAIDDIDNLEQITALEQKERPNEQNPLRLFSKDDKKATA